MPSEIIHLLIGIKKYSGYTTDIWTDGAISLLPAMEIDREISERILLVTNQCVHIPNIQRPFALMTRDRIYVKGIKTKDFELSYISKDPKRKWNTLHKYAIFTANMGQQVLDWRRYLYENQHLLQRAIIRTDHDTPARPTAHDSITENRQSTFISWFQLWR